MRDLVNDLVEAYGNLDEERLLELTSPEVFLLDAVAQQAGVPIGQGHDGVKQWIHSIGNHFQSVKGTIESIEHRHGRYLIDGHSDAVGKVTGTPMTWPWTLVLKVDDGVVTEFAVFRYRKTAEAYVEKRS